MNDKQKLTTTPFDIGNSNTYILHKKIVFRTNRTNENCCINCAIALFFSFISRKCFLSFRLNTSLSKVSINNIISDKVRPISIRNGTSLKKMLRAPTIARSE